MSSIPRFEVSSKYNPQRSTVPTKMESNSASGISTMSRDDSSRNSDRSMSSRDDDKLGFSNLSEQMQRKAVKKGFNFTLMVVGDSGLGKSTLVNSLLMQELYKDRKIPDANTRITRTTQIEKRQIELDERGIKLKLTIVDTPGFGDAVNAEKCWKPVEDYIDGTFEQFFKDECGLNRKNIQDNRVHCCLYFVSPYGHGLKPLDVEFMRRLHGKVNIVPIIAKADTLTTLELRQFKDKLREDLERHRIETYRLPECDSDEEDDIKRLDKEIKSVLPFAVIGSNCMIDNSETGKKVRGREYPWGSVEIDNAKHCDFSKLRVFLLKTHMQDLKDMTLEVHYEAYRAKYITERMSKRQMDRRTTPSTEMTPTRDEVSVDAEALLKQKEEELRRIQQEMNRMQEQLSRTNSSSVNLTNNTQMHSIAPPPVPGAGSSTVSLLSGSHSSLGSSAQQTNGAAATTTTNGVH